MDPVLNPVVLNVDTVPIEYRELDERAGRLGVGVEWGITFLSKYESDEKDVRRITLGGTPIGFLLPVISLTSLEHDLSEDDHFRRSAYQVYAELTGEAPDKEYDERVYILVCWYAAAEGKPNDFISLSICKYGIYPFVGKVSLYNCDKKPLPPSNISVKKTISINKLDKFMKRFVYELLPRETNRYARFMFSYQVIELFMDLLFHSELDRYRELGKSIGSIKNRISDISNGRRLIGLLFESAELNQAPAGVRGVVNDILGEVNGKDYTDSGQVHAPDVLYDFRNSLVHNYYRLEDEEALSHVLAEIEDKVIDLLVNAMTMESLRSVRGDFKSRFIID